MANADIKRRMLDVLDGYRGAHLKASDAERLLLHLLDSLEQIGSRHIETCRSLACRLVHSDLADGAIVECEGDEKPQCVLDELHIFIKRLPD